MTLNGEDKMNQSITIRVMHSLPGRVRLRLSLSPVSADDMIKTVKDHPGISEITFNGYSKSVLLKYDPDETSQEELIIRVAVFISLEHDLQPVRVYSDTKMLEMSESAFVSGFLILISLVSRIIPQTAAFRNLLDWIAGLGTAYSIFDHGYDEFKERGNFDPEVLSVIYLLTSFSQGKFLPSTLFTWIATFGRHLIRYTSKNVEIQPQPLPGSSKTTPQYEIVITPINRLPGRKMLFNFLPMLIMNAAMDNRKSIEGTLMDEMRKVSRDHGEVLEGFGKFKNGIPIRMQYSKN
jgi:hypothetical protein